MKPDNTINDEVEITGKMLSEESNEHVLQAFMQHGKKSQAVILIYLNLNDSDNWEHIIFTWSMTLHSSAELMIANI